MRRRRDELIAPDKYKNIIYVERRGRQKISYLPAIIAAVLSALCILYCLAIFLFIGYGTRFFLIWGVIGVALAGVSYLLYRKDILDIIPMTYKSFFLGMFSVCILVFVITEVLIIKDFAFKKAPEADYVIVLGAQWKTTGPSRVLKYRLDTAITYLKENPEAMVIVSGGQGANEPISEAQGMAGYLADHGIEHDRIIEENVSTNTNQNLLYSSLFLEKEKDRVVVVTNDFHVFRAVGIARQQGYEYVDGLAAPSDKIILPNNLLREFFGVWKDVIAKNMSLFH